MGVLYISFPPFDAIYISSINKLMCYGPKCCEVILISDVYLNLERWYLIVGFSFFFFFCSYAVRQCSYQFDILKLYNKVKL